MFLLPYRKIELYSPHSVDAVGALLTNVVGARQWLRSGANSRLFEGTVTHSSFDVQRIISYRNSFLPQIHGTITPEGEGSRILVTMQLHPVVIVFMMVWFGGVFFAAIAFVPAGLSDRANIGQALAPIGMFLFGSILTVGGFAFEARKAERLLVVLFDGVNLGGHPE